MNTATAAQPGVSYYLPIQYLRVTAERTKAPSKAELTKKALEAKKAADDVKADCDTRKASLTRQQEIVKQIGASGPVPQAELDLRTRLAADYAICALDFADKTEKLNKAETALANASDSEYQDTIKISAEPITADTSQRYVIDFNHEAVRSDKWTIKTTNEGLLSTANAKADDKSGDVLVELARAAGAFSAFRAGGGSSDYFSQSAAPMPISDLNQGKINQSFKYDILLDVANTDDAIDANCAIDGGAIGLKHLNKCLQSLGIAMNVRAKPARVVGGGLLKPKSEQDELSNQYLSGLAYRRPIPYVVSVTSCVKRTIGDKSGTSEVNCNPDGGVDALTSQSALLSLPNGAPTEVLPYESATFVTLDTNTEFTNGILTQVTVDHPSEALAIAQTPVKMIKGLADGIKSISPIQVEYTNNEAEAVKAQTALYQAQAAALKAQLDYQNALAAAQAAKEP